MPTANPAGDLKQFSSGDTHTALSLPQSAAKGNGDAAIRLNYAENIHQSRQNDFVLSIREHDEWRWPQGVGLFVALRPIAQGRKIVYHPLVERLYGWRLRLARLAASRRRARGQTRTPSNLLK